MRGLGPVYEMGETKNVCGSGVGCRVPAFGVGVVGVVDVVRRGGVASIAGGGLRAAWEGGEGGEEERAGSRRS